MRIIERKTMDTCTLFDDIKKPNQTKRKKNWTVEKMDLKKKKKDKISSSSSFDYQLHPNTNKIYTKKHF